MPVLSFNFNNCTDLEEFIIKINVELKRFCKKEGIEIDEIMCPETKDISKLNMKVTKAVLY
jgi:hypothetical protein